MTESMFLMPGVGLRPLNLAFNIVALDTMFCSVYGVSVNTVF